MANETPPKNESTGPSAPKRLDDNPYAPLLDDDPQMASPAADTSNEQTIGETAPGDANAQHHARGQDNASETDDDRRYQPPTTGPNAPNFDDTFDIDAALAAVASLPDLTADDDETADYDAHEEPVAQQFDDEIDDTYGYDDTYDYDKASIGPYEQDYAEEYDEKSDGAFEPDEFDIAPYRIYSDAEESAIASNTVDERRSGTTRERYDNDLSVNDDAPPPPNRASAGAYAPGLSTLRRGQSASAIPALLLIGVGGWLTFTLTTGAAPIAPAIITAITVLIIAVGFVAYWLSSARQATGTLFMGSLLLCTGGLTAYLMQPDTWPMQQAWPLYIVAGGMALGLTATLQAAYRRYLLVAIAIVVAGSALALQQMGYLPATLFDGLATFWPVVVIIVLFLFLMPFFRRHTQS